MTLTFAISFRTLWFPSFGGPSIFCKCLQDDLARLLGDSMTVVVETVGEIPLEKSGKRPIIKLAASLRNTAEEP